MQLQLHWTCVLQRRNCIELQPRLSAKLFPTTPTQKRLLPHCAGCEFHQLLRSGFDTSIAQICILTWTHFKALWSFAVPHALTCPGRMYRRWVMFKFEIVKSLCQTGEYTCERKRTWRQTAEMKREALMEGQVTFKDYMTDGTQLQVRPCSFELGTDVFSCVCCTKHCFFWESSCSDAERERERT